MEKCLIKESKRIKILKSENYNFFFDKQTGFFMRWGKTKEEDPKYSKFGPEIADIEISTICHGLGKPCTFCYKSNTPKGTYMSLKEFEKIFDKLPKTITQIAFGIGDIDSNPEMWDIFDYCIIKGVIPNLTINGYGLTDEIAKKLSQKCGAVAVSHYDDDYCFNAIKKLTDLGMKQINIHKLLSKETINSCYGLVVKAKVDERLKKLNAIVFLSLKPKGKRNKLTQLSQKEFTEFSYELIGSKINYGFDSCTANKFLYAMRGHKDYDKFMTFIEPCESTLFSIYCNVDGEFSPCSFCEGEKGWEKGKKVENFSSDIWNSKEFKGFRTKLLKSKCKMGQRKCPMFKV